MKRYFLGVAAAVLGTALVSGLALPTASAADPDPVTTVTLPLFGAPLTLDITSGPGGVISDVAVEPADGNVATHLKPHKVVFKSANLLDPTGDPGKVVIKSGHGGQSVSARAGSLGDISGPGKWSGDLFGTGSASTVSFTIGAAADGGPDITGITTSGETADVGDVKHFSGDGDDHEGDETSQSAWVTIKFTNETGDQSRNVTIAVRVRSGDDGDDDDDESSAKVSISVGRIKGVAGMAVGDHTWVGRLCDNTVASIAYTVAADGTITFGAITPAGATSATGDHGASVMFATGEKVRIKVSSHDGEMRVSVKEKIRCDSADPTTNATTSIPDHSGDHEGDGKHDGGHHGGD